MQYTYTPFSSFHTFTTTKLHTLMTLLKDYDNQLIAVVLAHLQPQQVTTCFEVLETQQIQDIMHRIKHLHAPHKNYLLTIEKFLRKKMEIAFYEQETSQTNNQKIEEIIHSLDEKTKNELLKQFL